MCDQLYLSLANITDTFAKCASSSAVKELFSSSYYMQREKDNPTEQSKCCLDVKITHCSSRENCKARLFKQSLAVV